MPATIFTMKMTDADRGRLDLLRAELDHRQGCKSYAQTIRFAVGTVLRDLNIDTTVIEGSK